MLVTKGLNNHIYKSVFSHTPYPVCLIMVMDWPRSTEATEISLYFGFIPRISIPEFHIKFLHG